MIRCKVCDSVLKENANRKCCPRCNSSRWESGYNTHCETCGKLSLIPNTHHIDGNKKNNVEDNLINLCVKCHKYIHKGGDGVNNQKSFSNDAFAEIMIKRELNNLRETWLKRK